MSKNRMRLFAVMLIAIAVFLVYYVKKEPEKQLARNDEIEKIVTQNMELGKILGLSICVIDLDGEYRNSFGYADLKNQIKVTNETLFQLGSMSKAFTAYAIELLIQKGVIKETDYVSKYIPGFYVTYKGNYKGKNLNERVDITITQLLHHTSGIPTGALVTIKESTDENALEECVDSIIGYELNHYPGESFEYSTINYDILGLIIEKVSGQSYEKYMEANVFSALGLKSTLANNDADIAKGYKQGFFGIEEYDAPVYKGNVPAGYIVTNIEDMSRWIKIQLKMIALTQEQNEVVNRTHIANRKNTSDEKNSYYCAGWYEKDTVDGTLYCHGGKNPNFSSYAIYNADSKVGICIMANINSAYVEEIANGIMKYYTGNAEQESVKDTAKIMNIIASFMIIFLILFILFNFVLIVKHILDIKDKKVELTGCNRKEMLNITVMLLIIAITVLFLFKIPSLLFDEADWNFAKVWMPNTLATAAGLLGLGLLVYVLYYILNIIARNNYKINLYALLVVSIMSGFGNASIIFTINTAVAQGNYFDKNLFLFFVLGLLLYVLGQRIVRYDLIEITNDIVLKKRKELLALILNAKYETFEKTDSGQIQSCLNNDTEVISDFSNTFVTGVTCIATIICCFCYMYIVNIYGFFITLAMAFVAVILYMNTSQQSKEYWEQARTCQSVFFKRTTDLLLGFKELSISLRKKNAFMDDIITTCEEYKLKTQEGGFKYAGVFIIGESVFTVVIGTIAFLFPLIFAGNQDSNIREYVFVLLYITGPINGVLNAIPNIMRVKISWKRICELTEILQKAEKSVSNYEKKQFEVEKFETITVENLKYKYLGKEEEAFEIGPISAEFHKEQISFIVGGNGSGKSTFVKLLTGLYIPTEGRILINGRVCDSLGELFSTVYSDYHLFDKLYGLDVNEKSDIVLQYMKEFKLEEKVKITKNVFSTTKLSTGQRKRLALLLAYLEDKPIFIFDEWTADQDPTFKEIFYNQILRDLKKKGKCIIAITHDDRYFDRGDQVLCMESGRFVNL